MKKLIFIGGATASGKSELAIDIAKNNKGEVISADSRQVYKNIPYFTGAVFKNKMKGISHHLLSFLDEDQLFSISKFQILAEEKIKEIIKRKNIPIIVGGSTFYFESLIYKNLIPNVPRNESLREKLEIKDNEELFNILKKKDKRRSKKIDKNNRPRIIRAIEIAERLGKVPIVEKIIKNNYEIFFIWLSQPIENQREKIALNVEKRIEGIQKEAKVVWKNLLVSMSPNEVKDRFIKLGQAFKHVFKVWDGKISLDEFIEKVKIEEGQYAKKQNTYLKKFFKELPKEIYKKQYNLLDENFKEKIEKDVEFFLK